MRNSRLLERKAKLKTAPFLQMRDIRAMKGYLLQCIGIDGMDIALKELISVYVETAKTLFPRVAAYVGVSPPISNIEWASLDIPQRGETDDGIRYFKHGYGVKMNDGSRRIDIDLGAAGEMDGFDAWRLFDFATQNKIDTPYSGYKDVEKAIETAVQEGELEFSGYILFYRSR